MRNSYRLATSLLAYAVFCIILYPFYRHVFDFDAVGYFAVTKHLAAGEWYDAINGYWSPLHCWLALPLYKAGLNEFDAFKIICILAGAGILMMVHRLLKKTAVPDNTATAALFTAIPIVLCYVFCYQAADILLCLLLLIYADLITAADLFENRKRNGWCGLVAAVAFFAKAYAFPFFILHFTIVQWRGKKFFWRNIRWGIGIFLLVALPWMAALFYKYRFVTFGYSGKLNIRWVLYGYGIDTRTLYALSPFPMDIHWKDPYSYPWNFTKHPSYFSWPILQKQAGVFFKNLQQLFTMLVFFSFLIPVLAFLKKDRVSQGLFLLACIFPVGYLLVALEIRYLFVLSFIALIVGAASLRLGKPGWVVFLGSFLIFPVNSLIGSVHKGESYFKLAKEIPGGGKWITNNFISYTEVTRVAYLKNATLYQFPREPKNDQEILPACRQAGIDYYFHYCGSAVEAAAFRQTELYKAALQEIKTSEPNLILLKLQ